MIDKNDVIKLLMDLDERGIDTGSRKILTLSSRDVPLDVLKFINDQRPIELTQFYEKLRKSYNGGKSKLYVNIVDDSVDPKEAPKTLSSYALQAFIYAEQVEDDQMFMKHARLNEVELALYRYTKEYDIVTCTNVLGLIRADLMACENITGRREEIG